MRDLVVITSPIDNDMITKESNVVSPVDGLPLGTNKPFTFTSQDVNSKYTPLKVYTRHSKIIEKFNPEEIRYNVDFDNAEQVLTNSNLIDHLYIEFLKNAFSSYEKAPINETNCKSPIDGGLVNYYLRSHPRM